MREEIKTEFFIECEAQKAATQNAYAEVAAGMVLQERKKQNYLLRKLLQDIGAMVEKELIQID